MFGLSPRAMITISAPLGITSLAGSVVAAGPRHADSNSRTSSACTSGTIVTSHFADYPVGAATAECDHAAVAPLLADECFDEVPVFGRAPEDFHRIRHFA